MRPQTLDSFIGQPQVTSRLRVLLDSAMTRNELPSHILLTGGPGLGKTSLAAVIANELGTAFHSQIASSCSTLKGMTIVLAGIQSGDVLFIDEIHELPRKTEELLGVAMEDGEITAPGMNGTVTIKIPPFVLIGATTLPRQLTGPLKARFGLTSKLEYYSQDELIRIVQRAAEHRVATIGVDAATMLAVRANGTTREVLRLLDRARDQATLDRSDEITVGHVAAAMNLEGIDELGLSAFCLRVLRAVAVKWAGRPIGLNPILAYLGDDAADAVALLERLDLVEQSGNGRGRFATRAGYVHLRLTPPPWVYR